MTIFDKTTFKFIIAGIINTLVGSSVMFILYNLFHLNYWLSSAMNYVIGSIVSYFLNKHFTFKNKQKNPKQILKFALNISSCYLIAYGIAKPAVSWLLKDITPNVQENTAMIIGMCFFTVLNYFGQKLWVFNNK